MARPHSPQLSPAFESGAPGTRSPRTTETLDTTLAIGAASLVALLALLLGGVTPLGHLIAVALGAVLALLCGIRAFVSRQSNASWVLVPAALFTGLVALQTLELGMDTLESIQEGTADLWREMLGEPTTAEAATALEERPLSLHPGATAGQLRLLLVGLVLLWTGIQLAQTSRGLQQLLGGLAAAGGVVAALGIAQVVTGAEEILWTVDVAGFPTGGPFVHRGHFAQFVNLGLGATLALLFVRLADRSPTREHQLEELFEGVSQPGRRIDLLLLVTAVVCLTAVGLSQARNGVISMLVAGVVLAGFVGRTRFLQGVGWPLVGMLLAAFGAVLVMGFDPVYERFADLPEEIDERDYGRLAIWRDAIAMWESYPAVGAGFGTFEWTFPAFDTATRRGTVAHAESLYVEVLAETGWAGALLMGTAVVGLLWTGFRRALNVTLPQHAAVYGLGFGLLALAFHQSTDFGAKTPAVAAMGLLCAGLLLGLGRPTEARSAGAGPGPWIAGASTSAVLAGLLAYTCSGALAEWSRDALAREAIDLSKRADRSTRNLIREASDYGRELQLLVQADELGREAGLHRDAEIAYWRAATGWRHAVATTLERERVRAAARTNPGLGAQAAAIGNEPFRDRDLLEELRAESRDEELRAAADAARGVLLDARVDAPTHGRIWSLYGELGDAWLDDEEALRWLERAARLAPHDPVVCIAFGRALLAAGDEEAAARWLRRAIAMGRNPRDVFAAILLEFVADPEEAPDRVALQAAHGELVPLRELVGLLGDLVAATRSQRAEAAEPEGAPEHDDHELRTRFTLERVERLEGLASEARLELIELLAAREAAGEAVSANWIATAAAYHFAEAQYAEAAKMYGRAYSMGVTHRSLTGRIYYAEALERSGQVEAGCREAERILRAEPRYQRARDLLDRHR